MPEGDRSLRDIIVWWELRRIPYNLITGGYFGASVARRVGRVTVRRAVIVVGLIIGCAMLLRLWL